MKIKSLQYSQGHIICYGSKSGWREWTLIDNPVFKAPYNWIWDLTLQKIAIFRRVSLGYEIAWRYRLFLLEHFRFEAHWAPRAHRSQRRRADWRRHPLTVHASSREAASTPSPPGHHRCLSEESWQLSRTASVRWIQRLTHMEYVSHMWVTGIDFVVLSTENKQSSKLTLYLFIFF